MMLASIAEHEKLKLQNKMKTEDIDKRIGMPDVDAEWEQFEREVIGQETSSTPSERGKKSHKSIILWSLSLAASVALVAGIFLLWNDDKELTGPTVAMANDQRPTPPVSQEEVAIAVETETASLTEQRTDADLLAVTTPSNTETRTTNDNPIAENVIREETVYDVDEEQPHFPGGGTALMEFIKTNLRYPDLAMEYGARGRVIMTFVIDTTGLVSDVRFIRTMRMTYDSLRMSQEDDQTKVKTEIAMLLAAESMRILKMMPRWEPGKRWEPGYPNGKPVNVRYTIPIKFQATEAERQAYLAKKRENE